MSSLQTSFQSVRTGTMRLCRHLEPEDFVVQSMPDASPVKWHLAHTSWFFEHFVLRPFLPGYPVFDERFHYLFNSYYYSAGQMHPRHQRGLLSRPLVREIYAYREYVDEAVMRLLDETAVTQEISDRMTLGLNHEQQHQELLLTDIKHAFSLYPDHPPVNPELAMPKKTPVAALGFAEQPPGMVRIGADSGDFCFDNETPGHEVFIPAHAIGSRLVTNGEFREFINDGGYEKHELWLSDGWAVRQQRGWNRPLYWSGDLQSEFTLGGQRDLDLGAPVAHVSYYEADAFARWSNCRLPTEAEWERSAQTQPVAGNLLDSGFWHPLAATGGNGQFFGDTWEWTSSAYAPYPGFKPLSGSLGEYNGKFMCNQMTVRGGSCVTVADHIRPSYRSFFYPDARWQFLGIRLAQDRVEER